MNQYGVAVLANGTTIHCELRLVLAHLVASEIYVLFDTLHQVGKPAFLDVENTT
jgi:hypothetical protein